MSASPAKKKASAKKPAEHPKYIEMITQAIMALKERTGSSRQAILKYIKENFKVGDNVDMHVKLALKRGVASGALAQPKGTGASGSFKAVKKVATPKTPVKKTAAKKPAKKPVAKKTPAKKAKKPAAKKPATKKFTPKKPVAKKLAAKKPAAKKPTAKKPAKKPAAKKAAKKPAKK